ncbi:hypothetical protein HMPREF0972_02052 [Actinomyces sp. oral taxon 848 str. F0332]|nr:hypothetical protein HMPREF0972_02052 [Actinomyces sp. oral taxon 848 str. F0332]
MNVQAIFAYSNSRTSRWALSAVFPREPRGKYKRTQENCVYRKARQARNGAKASV